MPTYCYRDSRGKVHERVFSMNGEIPPYIVLDGGQQANRCYQAERKTVGPPSCWPMTCCASGVNASDAQALRDHLAAKGVPTEVTADGDPVYRDAKHRRRALKARGFVDKSSFI